MKKRDFVVALLSLTLSVSAVSTALAQEQDSLINSATRPRTVTNVANRTAATQQSAAQQASGQTQAGQEKSPLTPQAASSDVEPTSGPATEPEAEPAKAAAEDRDATSLLRHLSPTVVRARTTEAKRLFKTRPQPTGMTTPSINFVTLAALDRSTSKIHLLTLPKQIFLTRGAEIPAISSLGTAVTVRILRANGVNTAVTIFDEKGQSLAPLVVEYPIERGGAYRETAYYASAHPAILSPELVVAGQMYVRGSVDVAASRLREKGIYISPEILDVAERLVIVEHVDHLRFRNENRLALYQEVFSLFALNELDTYRYAVSSAGAGGMVQMIPWAYNLMRQRHPSVGLNPDFVVGMRTHSNAMKAMLLYMRDTWNDLAANSEVQYALNAKLATQTELLAAGYNSNAARLPGYLRRGGSNWRTLIPRETQMYLQIYKNFESLMPIKPRTAADTRPVAGSSNNAN
ncbi:MAG TPA: hypothetical protein VMM84_02860 [Pyrinomonadaceae bacterium]|nr:hypothetical protein [Pyrinomonadaceae bacterium]